MYSMVQMVTTFRANQEVMQEPTNPYLYDPDNNSH